MVESGACYSNFQFKEMIQSGNIEYIIFLVFFETCDPIE